MKVELKITTGPTSFTIEMDKRQYSDPKLYIPKINGKPSVDPGKRWYKELLRLLKWGVKIYSLEDRPG